MRWLTPRPKHPTLTNGPMTAEGDVIDGRGDEQWLEEIFRHSLPRVARRAPPLYAPEARHFPLGMTPQDTILPHHRAH